MLIDDIQNQPVDTVQALGKGTPTDSDLAKERLRLLPNSARYDINNIWQALHCKTERADQLRTLAGKAPAYPRWNEAWLEYNYDGKHRRGILTQWDNEGMQYDCALFTEQNPVVEGTSMRVGIFPGSFKLYVDEEYRVVVPDINSRIPEDRKKECAEIIEAITTTMRVLNWSPEIAPRTVVDMSRTNQKRRAAGKRPLWQRILTRAQLSRRVAQPLRVSSLKGDVNDQLVWGYEVVDSLARDAPFSVSSSLTRANVSSRQ
jgi:hypothetical protein